MHNQWPQMKRLNTTHLFSHSSIGQRWGGLGGVLCLESYKAEMKMLAKLCSHLWDVGKNPVLSSCRLLAESVYLGRRNDFLLAVSQGSPSAPGGCSQSLLSNLFLFFFKILFIFREMVREGEREGEKHQWARDTSIGCPSQLNWGPGLQARPVSWPRIEQGTFWFTDQCSIHLATPTRAVLRSFYMALSIFKDINSILNFQH